MLLLAQLEHSPDFSNGFVCIAINSLDDEVKFKQIKHSSAERCVKNLVEQMSAHTLVPSSSANLCTIYIYVAATACADGWSLTA